MNTFLATLMIIGTANAGHSYYRTSHHGGYSGYRHPAPAAAPPAPRAAAPAKTVVEVAVDNPDFSTLVAAVKAAGLVDTLASAGPFTVFAPNNAAFAKIPSSALNDLLKPENKDTLTAILTRHVAVGEFRVAQVPQGVTTLKTANPNTPITVTRNGNYVSVSTTDPSGKTASARVIATDVLGSNGVIHVIDSVV